MVGRSAERERLVQLLEPHGPAVVFVHGPGGIGKSTLVTATLTALPLRRLTLEGRQVEPTVRGALAAVGAGLGAGAPETAAEAAGAVAAAGVDVVVIDSFECLNLLDGWVRNDLVPALPASVITLLVGRRGPNAAWRTAPGWRQLIAELVVGPMASDDLDALLSSLGVGVHDAVRIRAFAHGHPLAAQVAAEAMTRHPGLPIESVAPAEAVEELFEVLLDDLEPAERTTVEAASVLRRVTLPLLASVLGDEDVQGAWRALRGLSFTTTSSEGIVFSGVAQTVIAEGLELRDPARVRSLRARAARAILGQITRTPDWGSTADLIHLVQNPLIRHAYTPPGALQHPVERARADDHEQVVDIATAFGGPVAGRLAGAWWSERRPAFSVVRAAGGDVAAFSAVLAVDEVPSSLSHDPVVAYVAEHLHLAPMPPARRALLLRWVLGRRTGELTTPEVATLIVDLKRAYLELREVLERVYTVLEHWQELTPLLRVMGFDPLRDVVVGGRRQVVGVLDFGPGGVDRWIGEHVLAEQAVAGAAPDVSGPRTPPDVPVPFALTPREQEVLLLLAEGLTNVELADTLFISERTANRHVSNIFTKLGVRNRTQAARVAVGAGMVS